MEICRMNGEAHEIEKGLQTRRELLAALEDDDGVSRKMVTALRFSGVEQPTFRQPEMLPQPTRTVAPIDVELSTEGELAGSARESVPVGFDALAESARRLAGAFRLHNLSYAQRELSDFVATFQLLTVLADAAGQADSGSGDAARVAVRERLNMSLGALVDFNVNEDWISVADVLEHEIAEFLPQWAAVIRAGGESYSIS